MLSRQGSIREFSKEPGDDRSSLSEELCGRSSPCLRREQKCAGRGESFGGSVLMDLTLSKEGLQDQERHPGTSRTQKAPGIWHTPFFPAARWGSEPRYPTDVWANRRLHCMQSNPLSKPGGKEQDPFLLPQVPLQASCWPIPYFFFSSHVYTESSKEKMWGVWKPGVWINVRNWVFSGVQFSVPLGTTELCSGLFPTRGVVWLAGSKGENLAAIFLEIVLNKPCILCRVLQEHKPMQPGTEWNIQPFHSPAVFPACLAYGITRYACQWRTPLKEII